MATISSNKDIDYIQKDYSSSLDAMISYANVNFGPGTSANRLWTNFNADSFSRNWLEIVAYVSDALFFYFDVQATQTYLQTATVRAAVEDIAKQFGFSPATASSASGDVVFTVSGITTIPRGFRVRSTNGQEFYLTNAIVAGGAGEYTGTVLQSIIRTDSFGAIGLQNEEFNLSGTGIIRDLTNTNPQDISPQVTVNGNEYTLVSSFIRHDGSDTPAVLDSLGNVIGGGGRVFTLEKRRDGTEYIKFGDGVFGRKLAPSDAVTVIYRTGGGSAGNVPQNSVVQLVDSAPNVTAVNNPADFSGGADEQSIEQLRELIPASLRTLERAVAEQDYSDILVANFSEVFAASTEKNNTDPGIDINIYVVPQGTGITQITENTLLSNRLSKFLELRKMVTVQFQFLDAFGIDTIISLEVFITDTASKTTVKNAIQAAIEEFFDLTVGGVSGAGIEFAENILLKDIGDLVQSVDGVERFEIKKLTYRPRIDKRVLGLLTDYKASEVNIFPTVSESEWLLAAAGPVGETIGELLYDNTPGVPFTYESSTGKVTYSATVDLSKVAIGDTFIGGAGVKEKSDIVVLGDGTGEYEQTEITTVADEQGIQEITEITTVDALSIGGSYLTLQDLAGPVAIWFNVDGLDSEPSHGANRSLEVSVLSTDFANTVASSTAAVINADSEFSAIVSGAAEVTDLTFPAPAGINDSNYFLLNSANDENKYYVYFDKTGSAADPAISGRLPVLVDIQLAATADDVASAVQAELDALVDFGASVSTNVVTVTNAEEGITTDASNISVTGMSILVTTQGANGNTITVTNTSKASLPDVQDGNVSTGFTIETTQQGINPNTLDGTYFLLYDSAGSVAFWFDVDNSGTTIPTGAAAADRAVEITTVTSNMSANAVATQVQLAIDGDAAFSASVSTNKITVTDAAVGARQNAGDGINPTGFAFSTLVQGADAVTIGGKYWLLNAPEDKAIYYVWYNTGASADPAPAGTDAGIEVTIPAFATADVVADNTASAIDAFNLSEITRIACNDGSGLNGRYFILYQPAGSVAFWYNVSGGASAPTGVADSLVEISTVLATDSANIVATKTTAVIDSEINFAAIVDAGDNVLVTGFSTFLDDATAGTSGFTVTVEQQGVEFDAISDNINTVTVTNIVPGLTTNTRDGDINFTFSTVEEGTGEKTEYTILGVDNSEDSVYINRGQNVSTQINSVDNGSILNGNTSFNSFNCYRKILAKSTNLSINSITDNTLDLSVIKGTGAALSARLLLDNDQVFIDGEYATGDYFLVDSFGNIWEIIANTSNTLSTGVTAVNDAAITQVSSGEYRIVKKLVGSEILFNGSIFNIQFNSHNTIYSLGAQFPQIGTIGDDFEISTEQDKVGNLGTPVDIISFDAATKTVRLNGSPDLTGINTTYRLIDSDGIVFNITASDGRSNPSVAYTEDNLTGESILTGSGSDSAFAQGFKVSQTETYTAVSMHLKKEGNIVGNLIARIVEDTGGLPDLSKLVAISKSLDVTSISETTEKVIFAFANPPTLINNIQYHLVLSGDAAYQASQDNNTPTFTNNGLSGFTFAINTTTTGVVSYTSPVDLSDVIPGNFFKDNNDVYFKILAVDNTLKTLTISITATSIPDLTINDINDAACFTKDNIYVSYDDVSPAYSDGEMTTFDGLSTWSSFGGKDAIFSVEGPKSIKIDSNLSPVVGPGATISTRFYDDNNELSLVIGLAEGTITYATDVNAYGKGTVGGIPNSNVDTFIFRTSSFADDIVNLRLNEIPQINAEDIIINVFGGVD